MCVLRRCDSNRLSRLNLGRWHKTTNSVVAYLYIQIAESHPCRNNRIAKWRKFVPYSSAMGSSGRVDASLAIPTDPNSTLVDDVSKIWHDPDKGSICVHLKNRARCPYPALLDRLSGPVLAILDWQTQKTESGAGTVHYGGCSNKWLDARDFALEILILHCEDFGVAALERDGNKTVWLGAGFKSKCIEDSMRNQITADEGTTISIPSSIGGKGSYRLGKWVRRPGIPLRPLFTRHQPVVCTDSEEGYTTRATSRMVWAFDKSRQAYWSHIPLERRWCVWLARIWVSVANEHCRDRLYRMTSQTSTWHIQGLPKDMCCWWLT